MSRSSTKEIRLKLLEIESLNSRQVKVIVAECCFPPDLLRKNLKSKIEHCNSMVRIMNIKLGLKSSLKLWKLGSRFKNNIIITLKVWGEDGYHFRKESGNLYCNFIRNFVKHQVRFLSQQRAQWAPDDVVQARRRAAGLEAEFHPRLPRPAGGMRGGHHPLEQRGRHHLLAGYQGKAQRGMFCYCRTLSLQIMRDQLTCETTFGSEAAEVGELVDVVKAGKVASKTCETITSTGLARSMGRRR